VKQKNEISREDDKNKNSSPSNIKDQRKKMNLFFANSKR
jgi:hypothetical protein